MNLSNLIANVRRALKTAEAIAYGGRLRHRTVRLMG
jgi:hypothetical protein